MIKLTKTTFKNVSELLAYVSEITEGQLVPVSQLAQAKEDSELIRKFADDFQYFGLSQTDMYVSRYTEELRNSYFENYKPTIIATLYKMRKTDFITSDKSFQIISNIKALRELFPNKVGLKEAKDLIEDIKTKNMW